MGTGTADIYRRIEGVVVIRSNHFHRGRDGLGKWRCECDVT